MLRELCKMAASQAAAVFSSSFVLLSRSGRVVLPATPGAGAGDAEELSRFLASVERGSVEDAGRGYLVVQPLPAAGAGEDADEGTWLVRLRDGRLAAAVEYKDRHDAFRAIPPQFHQRSGEELVEAAIWALVDRDVSSLLALLAEDYTFSDQVLGISLSGATNIVNQLLVIHDELEKRSVADLEVTALSPSVIRAGGRIPDPQPPLDPELDWRWSALFGVERGLIRWGIRQADESAGPAEG